MRADVPGPTAGRGRLFRIGWALLLACVAGLSGACAATGPRGVEDPERDAAITAVLDVYMEGLNALDLERHVSTYHFPHFRHASGRVVVWATPEEALPVLVMPEADRLEAVRAVLEPDWDRSEWTRRDIVQADDEKVHVATTFVRLRADGSVIRTFDSLYVLTFEAGADGEPRWGIKGRSSFAP